MSEFAITITMGLWFGILTSISPCPLATNIAAISYISKKIESPKAVFWSGLLYTLGRSFTYIILASLLVASLLSIPKISFFLQANMRIILGPLLIITGLFLLEIIRLKFGEGKFLAHLKEKAQNYGAGGSFLLGILFALSFCPVSAALFFGSLIPLAIQYNSGFILPLSYGVGTALPVVAFAILLSIGMHSVSKWFNIVTKAEIWVRRATGVIFIVVGCYYTYQYFT